jgi:hypothetical protein
MKLGDCKRVVMFDLTQPEDNGPMVIEFRHYAISARQRSVNKGVKIINNCVDQKIVEQQKSS